MGSRRINTIAALRQGSATTLHSFLGAPQFAAAALLLHVLGLPEVAGEGAVQTASMVGPRRRAARHGDAFSALSDAEHEAELRRILWLAGYRQLPHGA